MAEGQFVGKKNTYLYISDDGQSYLISRDNTLAAVAGTDLIVATVQNSAAANNRPVGFTPRGVYWEATAAPIGARKFLICGTKDAALYTATNSQAVVVDGVAGITTGRKGETYTYRRLTNAPGP